MLFRSSLRPVPDSTTIGAVTLSRASCADRFSWNMSFTYFMAFSVFSTFSSTFLYPSGKIKGMVLLPSFYIKDYKFIKTAGIAAIF